MAISNFSGTKPENPNPSNPERFGTPHGSRELSSELVVW
jgi:hypothetical protein